MSIRYILIAFTFIFLFSCKNKGEGTKEVADEIIPVIDIEKAMGSFSNRKMNFSEFVEDITYVPLETTDESIAAGEKSRLLPTIVTENYIFYGESMYGRDGRFIRKMGRIGQGPGEYVLATDIDADEERQEFYAKANYSNNIYVYDFGNRFKRKVPIIDRGGGMSSLGNGKIFLSRESTLLNDHYEFVVFDTEEGEVLFSRSSGISKDTNLTNIWNILWPNNGKISYYEAATDTIFNLKETGEIGTPRFIINMGKYKYKNPNDENMVQIWRIAEYGQFLFFELRRDSILYYGAYNIQTGEIAINKFDQFFNNDIDGGFFWLFKDTSYGKDGFSYVYPHIAKELIETLSRQNSGYDNGKNQKMRELINEVDEEDNFIFYFFKLK